MLFPIKKILVCTDLSEHSDVVIKSADVIRQKVDGELDVLYISDLGLQLEWISNKAKEHTFYETFVGKMAEELSKKMKDQLERTGAKANILFKQGPVVQTISETLENGDKKYDLLLIGHNAHSGLLHHFVGSVARKLLASVSVPTLVIRKSISFDKIAGLVDERGSSNWMITSTLDFYRTLNFKEIEFVSLWHKHFVGYGMDQTLGEFKDNLLNDINYFKRDHDLITVRVEESLDLQVATQLTEIMKEDNVSVAVVKRNRGKKINKLLIGSETMRLLEMDTVNLMVMPV